MTFTIKIYNNNIDLKIINENITNYHIDQLRSKINRNLPLNLNLYFNNVININKLLDFINFYNITTLYINNIRCKENMDEIFNFINNNDTIEELIISGNSCKNRIFIDYNLLNEIINNNNILQKIEIKGCNIDDNIRIISDSLKNNNSLQELNLSWNNITNMDFIFDVLSVNRTINKIDFGQNCISNFNIFLANRALQNNNIINEIWIENDKIQYNNSCKNQIDELKQLNPLINSNIFLVF